MKYVIGVDVGGTCTDSVVLDEDGSLYLGKAFSTPPDFSRGVLASLQDAALNLDLDVGALLRSCSLFLHSTTVAENAIVNGALAEAALLTTRGFEDTMIISRGGYGRWSGLSEAERRDVVMTNKPPPLVPRRHTVGIKERTDRWGQILITPDPSEVESAITAVLGAGVTSVAICFLWSPSNPDNERVAANVVGDLAPDMFVTASHEISPVLGEYERMSTTVLNARLGPVISEYLASLAAALRAHGFDGGFLVMQGHGGLVPVARACRRPVGVLESGPVGGLLGSRAIGNVIDTPNIVTADMGGTTFKVGVVRDGDIDYQRESSIFRYHYSLPKVDVVSLGLAGGSVVAVDLVTGAPKIGPRSAGSDPGPVCYGFGGAEPTLTDVDALLGYLNPKFFLGGSVKLDLERARKSFEDSVAGPLGMETEEAAAAVYRLANSMMYDLLHKVTVERGLDPRRFTILACGGTAGMHVPTFGPQLGVQQIVVPHSASVHGAFGLVVSDVVYEEQATRPMEEPFDVEEINAAYQALDDTVRAELAAAGFSHEETVLRRWADLKYRRQVHILTTPLDADVPLTTEDMEQLVTTFETLYRKRYGEHAGHREAGLSLVGFRVRGSVPIERSAVRAAKEVSSDPGQAEIGTRRAYVPGLDSFESVVCYSFDRLRPGNSLRGPAIIWTPITTVVLNSGQSAQLDPYRNLVITGPDSNGGLRNP